MYSSLRFSVSLTLIPLSPYSCIYIYIYVCVCLCVCVSVLPVSPSTSLWMSVCSFMCNPLPLSLTSILLFPTLSLCAYVFIPSLVSLPLSHYFCYFLSLSLSLFLSLNISLSLCLCSFMLLHPPLLIVLFLIFTLFQSVCEFVSVCVCFCLFLSIFLLISLLVLMYSFLSSSRFYLNLFLP
jgi:hypothetical protein